MLRRCTARLAVPAFDDYMKKSPADIDALGKIRDAQHAELKGLNERAHRNVEYLMRMQQMEHEEKALHFGEAAGKLSSDLVAGHRQNLIHVRKKNDMAGRDKGIVVGCLLLLTFMYWRWTSRHYPYKNDPENRGILLGTNRTMGSMYITDRSWTARHHDTADEAERKRVKAAGKAEAAAVAVAAAAAAAAGKPE
jgi:hypothetical protein